MTRRRPLSSLLTVLLAVSVLVLALFGTACEPTDPDADAATDAGPEITNTFTCELGVKSEAGDFVPFMDGSKAELMLGFQGLLFITIHARIKGETPPEQVDCQLGLTIGETPTGSVQPQTDVESTGSGESVSTDIVIFLDGGSAAPYIGLKAAISSKLQGPHGSCVAQADVLLVDDDPCIHTGEQPICPEDEPTP